MKKTLIALAALGVVGAASAQVTVSGLAEYGMASTRLLDAPNATEDGTTTRGFGMRSANLNFSATEDLGGGLSVSANLGMDGVRGGDGITGNTASMAVSGGFGTVGLTAGEETCNGIIGSSGGVNLSDLNIGFQCNGAPTDAISYATPAMGPMSFMVLVADTGPATSAGDGAHVATVFYANYADGPIKAGINFTSYPAGAASATNPTGQNAARTRLTASYDAGAMIASVGYSTGGTTTGFTARNKQMVLGLSIPMGATTVGLGWAQDDDTTNATGAIVADKTIGMGVNVKYAMSKSTSIVFNTAASSGDRGVTDNKNHTELYISKSF